jgi:hypothetical protein
VEANAQDRKALFEIAMVLSLALGAVAGAIFIATSLPLLTIVVGAPMESVGDVREKTRELKAAVDALKPVR